MRVLIKNHRHPNELTLVKRMLTQQGILSKPTRYGVLACELSTEAWFNAVKESVEFMTTCGVFKECE